MAYIKQIKIILLVVIAFAFGVTSGVSVASDQPQYATKIIGATKKNFNVRLGKLPDQVTEVRPPVQPMASEIMPLKEIVMPELKIELEPEAQELAKAELVVKQEPIIELEIEKPVEKSSPFVKGIDLENTKPQSLELAEEMKIDISSYVIGSGDTLKVTVFGEKDLSGDYKVADDGTVAMPLIGAINLGNKKLRDAENIIELAYQEGYLKNPSVSIEVQESRPFFILGEVRRPGSYNYIANMNILQAVAISGGFTYRANRRSVDILRGDTKKPKSMSMNTKSLLQAGDIIFVRERFF